MVRVDGSYSRDARRSLSLVEIDEHLFADVEVVYRSVFDVERELAEMWARHGGRASSRAKTI
jgi:hypothetical protein